MIYGVVVGKSNIQPHGMSDLGTEPTIGRTCNKFKACVCNMKLDFSWILENMRNQDNRFNFGYGKLDFQKLHRRPSTHCFRAGLDWFLMCGNNCIAGMKPAVSGYQWGFFCFKGLFILRNTALEVSDSFAEDGANGRQHSGVENDQNNDEHDGKFRQSDSEHVTHLDVV